MKPSVSELNAIPRTTDEPSPASSVEGVEVPQTVHVHDAGAACAVTGFEGVDAVPVPMAFVAVRVNV
jgi:hypothetical protein